MTIDEAIRILTDVPDDPQSVEDPELPEAARLGSEALKREKEFRDNNTDVPVILLPGETPKETAASHEP